MRRLHQGAAFEAITGLVARCVARFGYRPCRLGEAQHPGPSQARPPPRAPPASWTLSRQPRGARRPQCTQCKARFEIDDVRVQSTPDVATRSKYHHVRCVGARFVSDAALVAGEGIDRQELGGFCEDLRRQTTAPPVPIEEEFRFQSDQDMLAEIPRLASAPPAPAPIPGDPAQPARLVAPVVSSESCPAASCSPVPASHASVPQRASRQPSATPPEPRPAVAPAAGAPRPLWWESVDLTEMLQTSVLTHPRIPQPMRAACSEARCAVYRAATDLRSDDRLAAWKLLFAMDRLLFWRDTRARKLTANFTHGRSFGTPRTSVAPAPGLPALPCPLFSSRRRVLNAWLWKARSHKLSARFVFPLGLEGDARALGPVRALFPHSPGDAMEPGVEQVDGEWGVTIRECAHRVLRSLPSGMVPGLDGSRFEFWKPIDKEDPALDLAARCIEHWALGLAPREVDAVLRRGRLLALHKKAGGLRPLLLAASFRRIALKAVMLAEKARIKEAVGPEQFALGVPAGPLCLMQALEAATAHLGSTGVNCLAGHLQRIWHHAPRLDAAGCTSLRSSARSLAGTDLRRGDASLVAGQHGRYARGYCVDRRGPGLPCEHGSFHDWSPCGPRTCPRPFGPPPCCDRWIFRGPCDDAAGFLR